MKIPLHILLDISKRTGKRCLRHCACFPIGKPSMAPEEYRVKGLGFRVRRTQWQLWL